MWDRKCEGWSYRVVTVFARYGAPSTCGSIKTRIWKRERDGRDGCINCNAIRARRKSAVHRFPLLLLLVLSYELNRQRNDCINGCNCRGIAVMCVPYEFCTDHEVK
jgi:hypothetical protein